MRTKKTAILIHDVEILGELEESDLLPSLWNDFDALVVVQPDRLMKLPFHEFCKASHIIVTYQKYIFIDGRLECWPNDSELATEFLFFHYWHHVSNSQPHEEYASTPEIECERFISLSHDDRIDMAEYMADAQDWLKRLYALGEYEHLTPVQYKLAINFIKNSELSSKYVKDQRQQSQWVPKNQREGVPDGGTHILYDEFNLEKIGNTFDLQPKETQDMLKKHLLALYQIGPKRKLAAFPPESNLSEMKMRFPNFGMVIDAIVRKAALSRLTLDNGIRLQPMLLVGPPGIGKTAFAKAVTDVLRTSFHEIRMNSLSAGFTIGGHDLSWSNGRPGLIWEHLALNNLANPVILLDEIDKVATDYKYNPVAHLYTLLETETARRFRDEAIPLDIDVSRIIWIATANDIGSIETPLLSRFTVFDVPALTLDQTRQIIKVMYAEMVQSTEYGCGYFQADLSDDIAQLLSILSPREMKKILVDALGAAALAGRTRVAPEDIDPRLANISSKRCVGFV